MRSETATEMTSVESRRRPAIPGRRPTFPSSGWSQSFPSRRRSRGRCTRWRRPDGHPSRVRRQVDQFCAAACRTRRLVGPGLPGVPRGPNVPRPDDGVSPRRVRRDGQAPTACRWQTLNRFVHVTPATGDVRSTIPLSTAPPIMAAATRWLPVESDATERQGWPAASVPIVRLIQLSPASSEVQMSPPGRGCPFRSRRRDCAPVESKATSAQLRLAAAVRSSVLQSTPRAALDDPPPAPRARRPATDARTRRPASNARARRRVTRARGQYAARPQLAEPAFVSVANAMRKRGFMRGNHARSIPASDTREPPGTSRARTYTPPIGGCAFQLSGAGASGLLYRRFGERHALIAANDAPEGLQLPRARSSRLRPHRLSAGPATMIHRFGEMS